MLYLYLQKPTPAMIKSCYGMINGFMSQGSMSKFAEKMVETATEEVINKATKT